MLYDISLFESKVLFVDDWSIEIIKMNDSHINCIKKHSNIFI